MGIEHQGDGAAWADFDNDGHLDLFVGAYNQTSVLYRNGPEEFTRILFEQAQRTTGVAWGDYDNDGYLDLFLANGGAEQFGNLRGDFLYRNLGDGSFIKMEVQEVGEIVGNAPRARTGIFASRPSPLEVIFLQTFHRSQS